MFFYFLVMPMTICHQWSRRNQVTAIVKMINDKVTVSPVLMVPWPHARQESIDLDFTTS